MEDKKSCLLLGVFYSRKFDVRARGKEPNRGQLFRDGVRSKALEDDGFIVRSLDNKHHETDVKSGEETHCNTDFTNSRRMSTDLRNAFGADIIFDHIILDYFFSPVSYHCISTRMHKIVSSFLLMYNYIQVGWARTRWTENFWKNTLAMLAENNLLQKGGKLWLPNLSFVQESINAFRSEINKYYIIEAVDDPSDNPLYKASEKVTSELRRCPDIIINETQLPPLLLHSKSPFLVLTRRLVTICLTPSKRKRRRRALNYVTPPDLTVSIVNSKKVSSEIKTSPSKRRKCPISCVSN